MGKIRDGLAHAWSVFTDGAMTQQRGTFDYGPSYSGRPDRTRMRIANERTLLASIYTRIAVDAAAVPFYHVRTDADGKYLNTINSALNNCLNVEANVDQAGRAYRQDVIQTMIEKGSVTQVPVETSLNPKISSSYDINQLRAGDTVQYFPQHVRVNVYNQDTGRREEVMIAKKDVAISENPFYAVMNEPNSTLQRLIRKLTLLDVVDEQSGSGKLDIIIQLPYVIKSDTRRAQAELRRTEMERQLQGSKYGIAYADGTEKIVQLNRPSENNLMATVEKLTDMVYAELGVTRTVMDGTADEKTMLNYYARTIEPLLGAVAESMIRSFITKTGRSQGQSIMYFRDPFKLVPLTEMADIADKFGRNKITAPNEIRSSMGMRPSKDPDADKLQNANMPEPTAAESPKVPVLKGSSQNGSRNSDS